MRAAGVRRIAFASTGSIYGEPDVFPTPETLPVPRPDLAVRRLQARRRGPHQRLLRGLRLPGLDLPLRVDPRRAVHPRPRRSTSTGSSGPTRRRSRSWATARQRKSYLYVGDCVDAMLAGARARRRGRSTSSTWAPRVLHRGRVARLDLRRTSGWRPRRRYTGGARGWVGDSPFIFLDTRASGRSAGGPSCDPGGRHADACEYLRANPWVLDLARAADGAPRRRRTGCGTWARHRRLPGGGRPPVVGARPRPGARGGPSPPAGSPLEEPGLAELRARRPGERARLAFTADPPRRCRGRGPVAGLRHAVTTRDEADLGFVRRQAERPSPALRPRHARAGLLAGAGRVHAALAAWRERRGAGLRFAYSPENLRLGQALEASGSPTASSSGADDAGDRDGRGGCFAPFSPSGSSGCRSSRPR